MAEAIVRVVLPFDRLQPRVIPAIVGLFPAGEVGAGVIRVLRGHAVTAEAFQNFSGALDQSAFMAWSLPVGLYFREEAPVAVRTTGTRRGRRIGELAAQRLDLIHKTGRAHPGPDHLPSAPADSP
mgnify:CR=1 FL=1